VLGAIKTAKHYRFGKRDVIVTVCTDAIDRYRSVMEEMAKEHGEIDETRATTYVEAIFHGVKTDWVKEGTQDVRRQWHNLKYFTWVEQQGKTVEELEAQRDSEWWIGHQQLIPEIDARIRASRSR
jgi:cysteine synthase